MAICYFSSGTNLENPGQHLDNDNLILSALESNNVNKMNSVPAAKCNGLCVCFFLMSTSQAFSWVCFWRQERLDVCSQGTNLILHYQLFTPMRHFLWRVLPKKAINLSAIFKSGPKVLWSFNGGSVHEKVSRMVLVVGRGKAALSNWCSITQLPFWRSRNEVRERRVIDFSLTGWPCSPFPPNIFCSKEKKI